MRPEQHWLRNLLLLGCIGFCPQFVAAIQSGKGTIVIPVIVGATIDSQDSDSIDFVLPGGKGRAVLKAWLAKFQEAGWSFKVTDQDSMSAEYELTLGGRMLEIVLDDPGFDEAEISISCESDFRLAFAGETLPEVKNGPVLPPAMNTRPSQSNAMPGETSLGSVAELKWEIEEGWKPDWWSSPNGKRFACRKWIESGVTIAVDGSEMGSWSTIDSEVVFSPDSRHHAFVADRDDNGKLWYYLVVDGVPGKPYEKLDDEIAFTADSAQVIFGEEHDDGTKVLLRPVDVQQDVIDTGHRFAAYQNFFIRGPHHGVGYVAAFSEREEALFWNGKQIGERFVDIDPEQIALSPDGQHVAFFAEISPVRLGLVVNGKIVREHNQFDQGRVLENSLTLSHDGKRAAWGTSLNNQEFVYLDGKPGKGYAAVQFPTFSKDGSRFVYLALKGESPVIVIDGIESQQYAMASQPEFSDDGKTLAYYAELNQKEFMVVNGKRHANHEMVTTPLISKDGSIVAYATVDEDKATMIVNGETKATHSSIGSPYFVPQSNRLAWIAFDEGKTWRLFVEGVEAFAFDDFLGYPIFSPNGRNIAIITITDKGQSLMIDGKSGAVYDRIVSHETTRPQFDALGTCYYLAVRNNELFLVETKISD